MKKRCQSCGKFSDRLGTLVASVEQAKRDIDTVNSGFAEGHERVLEELNTTGQCSSYICASISSISLVNRSQKGLLEIIGSPAQAIVLEEVKSSQADTLRKLTLLEDKAELVQRVGSFLSFIYTRTHPFTATSYHL